MATTEQQQVSRLNSQNNMPNVAFECEEYKKLLARWQLVSDCIEGEETIKKKKTVYLPQPNADNTSPENRARYEAYLLRAVFYNVTGRTLQGMLGQVFAKDPVKDLPVSLDMLVEDADGSASELDQLAKKALSFTVSFGRAGLLTDYPTVDRPASVAEAESGEIRPTLTLYNPQSIINWRVQSFGAKKLLTLVVLRECVAIQDDGYETKYEKVYRVLRLINGIYWVEIWKEKKDSVRGGMDYELISRIDPKNSAGANWNEIPFQFIGSENNDAEPDLPPLYDIASLNTAHYRNSADYEESCFIVGQPTPWFSGLTQEWVEKYFSTGVVIGSRSAIPLPPDGEAGLLQVEGSTMPKEAMDHKEAQMVALGAKLVENRKVQQTATEASLNDSSQTSILATCANNVSCAFEKCLEWAINFAGGEAPEEMSYELNTDFVITKLSAQDQAQVIANWQANATSFTEMRDMLRQGGVAFQKDEVAKEEMQSAGPDLGLPVHAKASEDEAQRLANETAAAKARAGRPPA
jgi:hypothetical protein